MILRARKRPKAAHFEAVRAIRTSAGRAQSSGLVAEPLLPYAQAARMCACPRAAARGGARTQQTVVPNLLGNQIANKVGPMWDIAPEGEMNNM